VNKGVRKQNEDKITEITKKATPQMLWKGAFTQLSNSKVEANFADARTYTYNGECWIRPITWATTSPSRSNTRWKRPTAASWRSPATSASTATPSSSTTASGSSRSTAPELDEREGGRSDRAQAVIGKTGETGFAGGDHLHYGVYLDGVAILPVEWWDAKWIRDNIEPKLEGHSGQEIHEAQQPARSRAKPAGKKRR
jgi:hypothetical protein